MGMMPVALCMSAWIEIRELTIDDYMYILSHSV